MVRFILILFTFIFADEADHLLLTRIVTQPDEAESFSIYNPTNSVLNLSDYYVCDDEDYYKMQTEDDKAPSHFINGFTARFPNINIDPNDTLTIVLNFKYIEYYGEDFVPDLVMYLDQENSMMETEEGSFGKTFSDLDGDPNTTDDINPVAKLNDAAELLILFYWDGNLLNPIQDVDYFLWGITQNSIDKSDVEGYKNDTPVENQKYFEIAAEPYYAYSRIGIDEIDEENYDIDIDGINEENYGNGITRHDETSENFRQSWEIIALFNLGCMDETASNYDPDSNVDDGSCEYLTTIDDIIHNCGDDIGGSIECDGKYDLSVTGATGCPLYGKQITTQGIIVDYFDITPYDGPHSFTIQDGDSGQIDFVVWPESSTHQDGFDITQSDLNVLTQSPYGQYQVKITGELGAYCDDDELLNINSEWQVTVEYESNIVIVAQYNPEDLGCTDPENPNYNPDALIDDGSCLKVATLAEIIHNCGDDIGEPIECDGKYDLSVASATACPLYEGQVTTIGTVVDYFDITPFSGPHSFTIQDRDGYQIDFVVWPESSTHQDGFDITQSDLNVLTQSPYGQYQVEITGELGAYCDDDELLNIYSEWQVTVEYESNINIILQNDPEGTEHTGLMVTFIIEGEYDDFVEEDEFITEDEFETDLADLLGISAGRISIFDVDRGSVIMDINISEKVNENEPSNNDLLAIIPDIRLVGEYNVEVINILQLSGNVAIIKPEPYVIIPTLGEKLDFTYSYPNNSRVIIRLFDLSGRFVTSLVDKYYEESKTTFRDDDQSSWDGRDQLGQIVPPGTYIMHMEVMNPVTGETQTDAAPIVVGVKN